MVEYFENLGFAGLGQDILQCLGFSNLIHCQDIDLKHLTNLLEEDIEQFFSTQDVALPVKAGFMACQNEVRYLQSKLDTIMYEKDKLRSDLTEANQRALLLAQEIDDQNARIEHTSHAKLR